MIDQHYERIVMAGHSRTDDGDVEQSRSGYQVELEELRAASKERTTSLAAYLVDMSKAEALDYMGDNRAAGELVLRHL